MMKEEKKIWERGGIKKGKGGIYFPAEETKKKSY